MFLATTALDGFWDKGQEILFLGGWCRTHESRVVWEGLRGTVLPSPWDEPGAVDRGAAEIAVLQEELLAFLAGALNEEHGARHGERYWRIVLGPWLLGFAAAVVDHSLHLDRALAAQPRLETWILDPRDRRTPADTADFAARMTTDLFHLQVYSELIEARGVPARLRRGPAEPPLRAPRAAARAKAAARGALSRAARAVIGSERIFADLYASPRQTLALMLAARFAPLGETISAPTVAPDPARRAVLARFASSAPYSAAAASLLPRHLPTLFLEGHTEFRRALLARWPRPPRRALTSVGWYSNETFKLLAAESAEAGGELVFSQHGGAYGMMDPIFSERHERRVADRYLTWGWTDARAPGAKLVPLPAPRLLFRPRRPRRASGEWLLVSVSAVRYPYTWYFANAPAAHRFGDQIETRARFLRALGTKGRDGLRMRLHHADLGWGHRARLEEEFPDLVFDDDPRPWGDRAGRFDLFAVDHPQTSILECAARDVPTLMFWDPALWRMRPEAAETLDGLRRSGILFDSPEEAAARVPGILADPAAWWSRPEARRAVAAFRERHARSSPGWLAEWTRALDA